MDKIGGDFFVDLSQFHGYGELTYDNYTPKNLFLSGRSALSHIFRLIDINETYSNRIHVPYYICESVLSIIKQKGCDIIFYDLDENYRFNIDYLTYVQSGDALLLVNYFGFTPNNEIIEAIRSVDDEVIIINDDVHSYWTYEKSQADYSFTSLRKHFPVCSGGIIHTHEEKIWPSEKLEVKNEFFYLKLLGGILKGQNVDDRDYLKILNEAEKKLDNDTCDYLAPELVSFLFSRLDLKAILEKRKENYQLVYEMVDFDRLPFMFPYDSSIVPMNIPLLVSNKDEVIKKLRSKHIYLPSYWPISNNQLSSVQSRHLSSNQLSILIDQRYSEKEIEKQVDYILKYIKPEIK